MTFGPIQGSSQPRDHTQVSHIAGRFFTIWATRKPKNTGVGSLFLLQWVFPTQELNQGLLHCRGILYQLYYQGTDSLSSGSINYWLRGVEVSKCNSGFSCFSLEFSFCLIYFDAFLLSTCTLKSVKFFWRNEWLLLSLCITALYNDNFLVLSQLCLKLV